MTSQTAASRGYVLFDIKMAFMPSVVWCRKGHTRILKLSADCGHTRGVFKTWKNTDYRGCKNRLVRNTVLFDPNFQMHSTKNERSMIFSSYSYDAKRGPSTERQSPLYSRLENSSYTDRAAVSNTGVSDTAGRCTGVHDRSVSDIDSNMSAVTYNVTRLCR